MTNCSEGLQAQLVGLLDAEFPMGPVVLIVDLSKFCRQRVADDSQQASTLILWGDYQNAPQGTEVPRTKYVIVQPLTLHPVLLLNSWEADADIAAAARMCRPRFVWRSTCPEPASSVDTSTQEPALNGTGRADLVLVRNGCRFDLNNDDLWTRSIITAWPEQSGLTAVTRGYPITDWLTLAAIAFAGLLLYLRWRRTHRSTGG
jgi:hypothetical protein